MGYTHFQFQMKRKERKKTSTHTPRENEIIKLIKRYFVWSTTELCVCSCVAQFELILFSSSNGQKESNIFLMEKSFLIENFSIESCPHAKVMHLCELVENRNECWDLKAKKGEK